MLRPKPSTAASQRNSHDPNRSFMSSPLSAHHDQSLRSAITNGSSCGYRPFRGAPCPGVVSGGGHLPEHGRSPHGVGPAVQSGRRDPLSDLVLDNGLARGPVETQLTFRIEVKDGQVFEHRYATPPADLETLFTDPWRSHASEVRWTLTTRYEARQLKAMQAARRQSKPPS